MAIDRIESRFKLSIFWFLPCLFRTKTYGTFLSSHKSGKCNRISSGSVSAASTMNSACPRLRVLVATEIKQLIFETLMFYSPFPNSKKDLPPKKNHPPKKQKQKRICKGKKGKDKKLEIRNYKGKGEGEKKKTETVTETEMRNCIARNRAFLLFSIYLHWHLSSIVCSWQLVAQHQAQCQKESRQRAGKPWG